jgi:phosphoglycerol transferase MdoB-like AlkP superfamily enzyme
MTDYRLDQSRREPRVAALKAGTREIAPRAAWAIGTVAATIIVIYLCWKEGGLATILFTAGLTFTIGSLIALASRRVLFALIAVASLMLIVRIIAYIKQQATEVTLHAYDLVWILSSRSALMSLLYDHPYYVLGLLASLTLVGIAGWITFRVDSTRVPRSYASVAVAVFVFLAVIGAVAKGERRHTEFYFDDRYLFLFFSSWSETIEALWRGQLIQATDHLRGARLKAPTNCEWASKPPHIILIHQESVVPPSHFPSLHYDRTLDPFFLSHDGRLHNLRVETYGGASWLTEFSILTGLSTFSFGGMRQVVQLVMAGKVRETLPQALTRCGYRNVVFYPMLRHFLATGKFFAAVGLQEIFDAKDQRARLANERDRFYYGNALAEMERHFKTSTKPLFTFVETMATHGAYDYTYMPEVDVPGGGPGTNPEMHEYLRRLAMARMDYAFLRAELSRRFPDQQFLIVHYGDHQPTATRTLLGFGTDADIEQIMRSGNSAALITYYAIDAVNYEPSALPNLATVDVPYLGTLILSAAHLPLSEAYRERVRLMLLCNGRYHDCPEQDAILNFHRQLIDSALLEAR